MKPKYAAFFLCFCLLAAVHAWALPGSCGKENVQFKVATRSIPIDLKAPGSGQAQIVFLETVEADGLVLSGVEARLGVDGAWVGATKGNSFFALTVPPGEHHLCANWPADFAFEWERTSLASLHAEAGKVYYYRIKIAHIRTREIEEDTLDLMPVNEDEGKYLFDSLDQATATVKK